MNKAWGGRNELGLARSLDGRGSDGCRTAREGFGLGRRHTVQARVCGQGETRDRSSQELGWRRDAWIEEGRGRVAFGEEAWLACESEEMRQGQVPSGTV